MKLMATIEPRTDGTVTAMTPAGRIVFAPNAAGDIVGEVPDDCVAALLDTGNFEPADEADFSAAEALMAAASRAGAGDSNPDDSDLDDDAPLVVDMNDGLPMEGVAPPKKRRGRPPKARPAVA